MVLRVFSTGVRGAYRRFSQKSHHTVLPADTFEGKIITKSKILRKPDCSGPTKYGGRNIVTMLPGAHPGPKLMNYVKDVFKTAHVPVDFEEIPFDGNDEDEAKAREFEELTLTSIHRNGVGLKGNVKSNIPTFNTNVALREELDLFVCVVHVKGYQNVKCKYPDMDVIICRQNTEGEYAMLEHEAKSGVVESLKIITKDNTERFAEWCFEFAQQENRNKITIVHKANIMKLSDGLFLKVVRDVAKEYPKLQVTDMIVDNCAMQMVQDPSQFEMMVTPNLYGNILSNIASGLTGGAGLMSGRNYGATCALFEAGSRHLTFLDEDVLNPVAMLNASSDLLHYLSLNKHAHLIQKAIEKTLSDDQIHTKDIHGSHSSDEMVESIKENIRCLSASSDVAFF